MESELESGLSRSAGGAACSSAPEIAAVTVEDKADFYVLSETPVLHLQFTAPEHNESAPQVDLAEGDVASSVCESNASEEDPDDSPASRNDGAVDVPAKPDNYWEDESDNGDFQAPSHDRLNPETDRRQETDAERAQREKEELEEYEEEERLQRAAQIAASQANGEALARDGGRLLFPLSQLPAIAADPDAHRALLLPWQLDDWFDADNAARNDVEWVGVLESQLRSWGFFRDWQRVNHAASTPENDDDDAAAPGDDAREERLMRIYRETWGVPFSAFAERLRARLARHGCVMEPRDLGLCEAVEQQDALAPWIEYASFELRAVEGVRQKLVQQRIKRQKRVRLIADPGDNGGRPLSRAQKTYVQRRVFLENSLLDMDGDIAHTERELKRRVRRDSGKPCY